jgi:RNA polymerase sigma-70 factor (ECF subfamily)
LGEALTTSQQDERTLVEAAQADPACFVELYDRHFSHVWAFVMRRTSSRAEAEDVTSEVFRKALEHLPSYEWRGTPFKAWLFRIASNTLATRWQKNARESRDVPPDVAEAGLDVERHAMLFELVHRLPAVQREVIELRFIEGRSLLEIAAVLGKTEGAVKQLQKRALDTLRAVWEGGHA